MNQTPSVAPITTAASSQQTIADLQAQMLRYTQAIDSINKQARADYGSLQSAITTGNVTEAQAALSRLERDNWAAGSAGGISRPAASAQPSHAPALEAPPPNSLNKVA